MSQTRDSNLRLTDEEFVQAFEACTLREFHHRDHIRAAWLYLRRYKYGEAAARMAEGIRRFARFHGAQGKYHETVTRAWMRFLHDEAGKADRASLTSKLLRCGLCGHPIARSLLT